MWGERDPSWRCVANVPWRTWSLGVVILLANVGVFDGTGESWRAVTEAFEFHRTRLAEGELWRLLTGSLVHWSPAHLGLDLGAFLVVGTLCERKLRGVYSWSLSAAALAVGLAAWIFAGEVELYRGLSGVASGQFAVALAAELRHARSRSERLLVLAAVATFGIKILYEAYSGSLFFSTDALGDLGTPLPLAHVAGALAALGMWMLLAQGRTAQLMDDSSSSIA